MNTTTAQAVEMAGWAHARGLQFVPWSFQLESKYISPQFHGNGTLELSYFYGCLGAAGVFHEFPDHAREVLADCLKEPVPPSQNRCSALCQL